MPKKFKEDFDEEDIEDEENEFDEEVTEEEPKKERRGRPKKEATDKWTLHAAPEVYTVFNPKTKEVIAQSNDVMQLVLQLSIISAQKSTEAAKGVE